MFTRRGNWERRFADVEQFRRQFEQLFEVFGPKSYGDKVEDVAGSTWPRTNLFDTGEGFVLRAEVPGLSDEDLDISVNQEVLTLSGELKAEPLEGYSVHRQERQPVRFSRSFSFPASVDIEKVSASLKNGILTIQLAKKPEAQPRQISIKSN